MYTLYAERILCGEGSDYTRAITSKSRDGLEIRLSVSLRQS